MRSVWNSFVTSSALLWNSKILPHMVTKAQELEGSNGTGICNVEAGCCACSSTEEDTTTGVMLDDNMEVATITILSVGAPSHPSIFPMVEEFASAFNAYQGGRVNVIVEEVGSTAEMANEIRRNSQMKEALYDGYVSNPGVVGTAVVTDPPGFLDLGDFVRESSDLNWLDILPAFRDVITTYDGNIYMIPLDGDVHSLFYRIDILKEFDLPVPRTWDEYVEVAKATHGKTYKNTTLNGSCIGRTVNSVGQYYANLVLAPITQTLGTRTGFLFDSENMTPLTGEALAEAIRQLELQAKYGTDDEFEDGGGGGQTSNNIKHFLTKGDCVLTYNWGDNYKKHLSETSKVAGLVGVAPTPGSSRVLDRETGKLVPCNADRCQKFGTYYEDIGWVNKAPYAAFGGWAAAVAGNVDPMRQRLAADFFAFASGMQSYEGVIPNATAPLDQMNGQDPYRKSHLNIDLWVEQGFPREGTETYSETILKSLSSKNLALDIRFPESDKIYGALDKGIYDYLLRVENDKIAEADKAAERLAVANKIGREWETIIKSFDIELAQEDQPSILVQYQRSLGIYRPPHDYNYIGSVRYFGWTLASLVVLGSIVMTTWVAKNRKARIVRASQPIFLVIISFGCFLMGAGMYPLSIDDEIASSKGCDIACMASPWLLVTGFSCSFSALFSKTLRVNKLFAAARSFQRVTVSVKNVMKPFIILLSLNILLLSVWTGVNPLVFKRVATSPVSSYGHCELKNPSGSGFIPLILIALLNIGTLFAANMQAFRARTISDEFSESKYIALALLCIFQATLIGIPVAFMTLTQPHVFSVIVSCLMFTVAMSLLLLIFIPKIMQSREKAKIAKKRQPIKTKSGSISNDSESEGGPVGMRIIGGPKKFSAAEEMYNKDKAAQEEKQKLRDLQIKLTEQGIDAAALFSEVGLSVLDEKEHEEQQI